MQDVHWFPAVPRIHRAKKHSKFLHGLLLASVALPAASMVSPAGAASGAYVAGGTPGFVAAATDMGPADPSTTLSIAVWLHPRNQAALDALAPELYNPASPKYRHWLTHADMVAQFAPDATQSDTVRGFLSDAGLSSVTEGPDHFYLRATGTVAQLERAFHVRIETYQFSGQTIRANATDPYVDGPAGGLLQSVSGLDSVQFQHTAQMQPSSMAAALRVRSAGGVAAPAGAADASSFQSVCFGGPTTSHATTAGGFPKATYTGNTYAVAGAGCAYTPANVATAYHLDSLYKEGYDGTGQTIVLIDPCGSPTITADANAFSKRFGLPPLTSANFSIVDYPTPSACGGEYPFINGDVEWAHAIAPGAGIVLLVPPSGGVEDIDEATYYAATGGIGNIASGSYYIPETFVPQSEATKENLISELAAVMGVATNYASGDASDYTYWHLEPTVSVPADLPYATGVGGISTALNADGSLAWQTGWESHVAFLTSDGTVNQPALALAFTGFAGGSGGGSSAFFAKPSFQSALQGAHRKVPDIAWLADPDTGGLIVVSQASSYPPQVWYVYGGTELATPMFSALWAIANQEAGVPLGQAAPYLYRMPATTITDMVVQTSVTNVKATVALSASEVRHFGPTQSLAVVAAGKFGPFYSAYGMDSEANTYNISFGADYFLHLATGWDPVTGLGAPNAQAFADWFRAAQ